GGVVEDEALAGQVEKEGLERREPRVLAAERERLATFLAVLVVEPPLVALEDRPGHLCRPRVAALLAPGDEGTHVAEAVLDGLLRVALGPLPVEEALQARRHALRVTRLATRSGD